MRSCRMTPAEETMARRPGKCNSMSGTDGWLTRQQIASSVSLRRWLLKRERRILDIIPLRPLGASATRSRETGLFCLGHRQPDVAAQKMASHRLLHVLGPPKSANDRLRPDAAPDKSSPRHLPQREGQVAKLRVERGHLPQLSCVI